MLTSKGHLVAGEAARSAPARRVAIGCRLFAYPQLVSQPEIIFFFIVYTFLVEDGWRAVVSEGGLQPTPKTMASSAATQQKASAKPPKRQASRNSDIG